MDFGGFICFGFGAIALLAGCALVAYLFYTRSPNRWHGLLPLAIFAALLFGCGAYLHKVIFVDEALAGAAWSGDVAKVQSLLARGANPEAQFEGRTALELATDAGHTHIVTILKKAGAKK